MSYQVLARKWRPRIFSEMVGQEHVLKALINALDHNRLHHAYLFTGTRGVGKTTVARILARCLNCETGVGSSPCGACQTCIEINEGRFVDLIEVDAASRTKVEDTRELLDNVQYSPTSGRYKIYLIDEVHMLSNSSFNALLKTLEEPPEHVKFLLATTDPQKLPATILSRCLQFNLKNMSPEKIVAHLQNILAEEMVEFDTGALWQLARAADGSMRDGLSLTDQAIAFGNGKLKDADVASMLGSIDHKFTQSLVEALLQEDGGALLDAVAKFAEHAPDYSAALADLQTVLHRIAIAQALPSALDNSFGDKEQILAFASQLAPEDVQLFYQTALMGQRDLQYSAVPRTGFEMTLLRMLAFKPQGVVDVPTQTLEDAAKQQAQVAALNASRAESALEPPVSPAVETESAQAQEPAAQADQPPWSDESAGEGSSPKKPSGADEAQSLHESFVQGSTGTETVAAESVSQELTNSEPQQTESTQSERSLESGQHDNQLDTTASEVVELGAALNTEADHGITEVLSPQHDTQAEAEADRLSSHSSTQEPSNKEGASQVEHVSVPVDVQEAHSSASVSIDNRDSEQAEALSNEPLHDEPDLAASQERAQAAIASIGQSLEGRADDPSSAKNLDELSRDIASAHVQRAVERIDEPTAAESNKEALPKLSFDEFQPHNWISVYNQLAIAGVLRMTASGFVCINKQGRTLYFLQDQLAGGFLNKEHAESLGQALSVYFSESIEVNIEVGELQSDMETPAQWRERKKTRAPCGSACGYAR